MHYQQKLDQLFGKGTIWQHRTLRTLLDPDSYEYTETTAKLKLRITII